MKKILLTGGAGYIGSHVLVELLQNSYQVAVVDNLCNSSIESINRVEQITGGKVEFFKLDLRNENKLEKVFRTNNFHAVMHFAALKSIGESIKKPLQYYENNISGTFALLNLVKKYKIKNFIYSSTAAVYGNPSKVPITESFPLKPMNPYARSKLVVEEILHDTYIAEKTFNIIILRYFNPVGAHKSGLIGEDPRGIPNNLVPYLSQVAIGKIPKLKVFGDNYDTVDGTGVRDYIHIVDLARGHVKALKRLEKIPGIYTYNLGTGCGYSVLQVIQAFEKASGKQVPYEITERRPGDMAIVYADPTLAKKEMNWIATKTIDEMCEDVWRWQSQNPNGYSS